MVAAMWVAPAEMVARPIALTFWRPAGYAVFAVNYRLAPKYPYPYMVYDVERSIRYLRYHAKDWDADPQEDRLDRRIGRRLSQ